MPETQNHPKQSDSPKSLSALPITARAIVTFWFQQLIFAPGVPPVVTFSPQLDFPGPWRTHTKDEGESETGIHVRVLATGTS